ncbi:protein maelstrom homolog [Aplysia californica]|uniref:Protein maelstrom homolog n=1 Tax=Aplysia californica TaxID=6500 RepID=A0ABM0JBL7_APLCA|nr:protein maelstrom homolog [Aplysia californica]
MPPKKAAPNGFYMFMQARQAEIKKQTKRAPTMREMPHICREAWNAMSAEGRAKYEDQAKKAKSSQHSEYSRKDALRQKISDRIDPVKENEKRRLQDNQNMRSDWNGQNLLDIKFHIINFQVMYSNWTVEHRLPMEVGMICITLRDGLIKDMHRFINPGDAPEGYRSMAMQHSEQTHQIPINFEHGDTNFRGLWKQIEQFLADDLEDDDIPPVFCLSSERQDVETCLEYIYDRAATRQPKRVNKVYCLEDMAASLIMLAKPQSAEPSKTQLLDAMQQNRWDYRSDIRCFFHEENDCSHCAISKVRRFSFSLFDMLASVLGFKLTGNHLPDDTATVNTVFHPATIGPSRYRESGYRDREPSSYGGGGDAFSPPRRGRRERSPDSVSKLCPVVSRVQIQLSDEDVARDADSDEEGEDDDDDVLHTQEVKSTADRYQLKELRLPKSVSIAQSGARAPALEEARVGAGDAGVGEMSALSQVPQQPAAGMGVFQHNGLRMGSALAVGRGRPVVNPGAPGLLGGVRPPPGFPALAPGTRGQVPSAWGQVGGGGAAAASAPTGSVWRQGSPAAPSSMAAAAAASHVMGRGAGPTVGRGAAPPPSLSAAGGGVGGRGVLPMGRGRGLPMGRGYAPSN